MSGAPAASVSPRTAADDSARDRLRRDLLGWGQERPRVDAGVAAELRARLEEALVDLGPGLDRAVASTGRGQLRITKTRLDRLTCDGLQLDPRPFEHTRANVRGILTHKALELEVDGDTVADPPDAAAALSWRRLATLKPGDPSSVSAWLNACPEGEAAELRAEVAELLAVFREVFPELPRRHLRISTEKRLDARLAGGRVRLQGTLDLVVDSPVRDDRARMLVVDHKTGVPRSEHDRHEVRFYALLAALATGRLPFRWATFYVTEGRAEVEDLGLATLDTVVRRVVDAVRQAARLADVADGVVAPTLRGGLWCRGCRREDDCDEAARARARWAAEHPTE